MSASFCSRLGKLVSSRTAFRFGVLLRTRQSCSVGPVSPLMARALSPAETTKPQDSTGWLTGMDWTWYLAILNDEPALNDLSCKIGFRWVGIRVKSGQRKSLNMFSRSVREHSRE